MPAMPKADRPKANNPMSGSQLDFYRARVDQARAEAEAATLEHVRERCRRSEAAWSALAERAERSEQRREAEIQRKAQDAPQLQE
jgi:hypothetical protein